ASRLVATSPRWQRCYRKLVQFFPSVECSWVIMFPQDQQLYQPLKHGTAFLTTPCSAVQCSWLYCNDQRKTNGVFLGQVLLRATRKSFKRKLQTTAVLVLEHNQIMTMEQNNIEEELENQFQDVLTRLQSKELFQSDWDIASFAVFFIFVGMVLLLIILVLIRCCCCCCCDADEPRKRKVGIDNLAMVP
ncbi:hypothetical protein AAFF_G00175850, partial [Aldrovandia affinis]